MSMEGEENLMMWESNYQSWGLTNSENFSGGEEEKERKLKQKTQMGSTSNSPRETERKEKEVVEIEAAGGGRKKKSRGSNYGGSTNNANNNKEKLRGKAGGGGDSSDHEIHIWTERERRKKMRNMFSSLHALLPQLPPKADKSTIVDEAVKYIKTLEHTVEKLEKKKQERLHGAAASAFGYELPSLFTPSRETFLADQGSSSNFANNNNPTNTISAPRFPAIFQTWTSNNVVLNICGDEAQISICSLKKPGLFGTICYVLEKHKLEVTSAHVSSDCNRTMFMIQAHASGGGANQFSEAFAVEEIFRQAAAEIMLWVSS